MQVAVEVMSKSGAESLRRKELRLVESSVVFERSSCRAMAKPSAETAIPELEATSWEMSQSMLTWQVVAAAAWETTSKRA